jgi:hypothetical protein
MLGVYGAENVESIELLFLRIQAHSTHQDVIKTFWSF